MKDIPIIIREYDWISTRWPPEPIVINGGPLYKWPKTKKSMGNFLGQHKLLTFRKIRITTNHPKTPTNHSNYHQQQFQVAEVSVKSTCETSKGPMKTCGNGKFTTENDPLFHTHTIRVWCIYLH